MVKQCENTIIRETLRFYNILEVLKRNFSDLRSNQGVNGHATRALPLGTEQGGQSQHRVGVQGQTNAKCNVLPTARRRHGALRRLHAPGHLHGGPV
jgi:hypothetical protein